MLSRIVGVCRFPLKFCVDFVHMLLCLISMLFPFVALKILDDVQASVAQLRILKPVKINFCLASLRQNSSLVARNVEVLGVSCGMLSIIS